jgi:hypothetical protein
MKKLILHASLLVVAGVVLSGCGNGAYELSAQEKAAFNDAKPEIKTAWENGRKADSANDYLGASTNYRALLSQPISPQQLVAVQTALDGLNQRMNEAAAKGSPAAKNALDALKNEAPHR